MGKRPPEILVVSSGALVGGQDAHGWLAALAEAEVDAVQLREKEASDRQLHRLCSEARRVLPARTTLLVNRRADLALASGADGVHLPASGIPTAAARRLLGEEALIGRSTHRLDEVERAFEEGADYVTFGPVFFTPSKARYGPPVGLDALAEACRRGAHVVALGGITMDNAGQCVRAGARGIAAITLFSDTERLMSRVHRLRGLFRRESH